MRNNEIVETAGRRASSGSGRGRRGARRHPAPAEPRARTPDHDFGLYYEPDAPIDVAALQAAIAPLVDDAAKQIVTRIGEWGPRINGGGWLSLGGNKVDLLYRDLGRVRSAIAECRAGRIAIDYQPGHPHGFSTPIYMGEIAICVPLCDPAGVIGSLKADVHPFPEALKTAIVGKFRWEVQFSIDNAALAAKRSEQTHVAGCAYRALCCIAQVLFAVNGRAISSTRRRRWSKPRHFL